MDPVSEEVTDIQAFIQNKRKSLEEELGMLDLELMEINEQLEKQFVVKEVDEPREDLTQTNNSNNNNKTSSKKRKRSSRKLAEPDEIYEEETTKKRRGRSNREDNDDKETETKMTTRSSLRSSNKKKSRPTTRLSSRRIRLTPALEYCSKVLQELIKSEDGYPFKEPVDPVELNIPDYFDVIKRPMDLGTIQDKLHGGEYQTTQEFCDDVRLVWSNAKTYNDPDHDVYKMAERLEVIFEEQMAKVEEFECSSPLLVQSQMKESLRELKESMKSAEKQLRKLREKGIQWSKAPDYSAFLNQPRDTKMKPRHMIKVREMTFEQKSKLSELIHQLNPQYINGVVQIIEEEMPHFLKQDTISFELDLDNVDTMTICRLQSYVKKCLKEQGLKK